MQILTKLSRTEIRKRLYENTLPYCEKNLSEKEAVLLKTDGNKFSLTMTGKHGSYFNTYFTCAFYGRISENYDCGTIRGIYRISNADIALFLSFMLIFSVIVFVCTGGGYFAKFQNMMILALTWISMFSVFSAIRYIADLKRRKKIYSFLKEIMK